VLVSLVKEFTFTSYLLIIFNLLLNMDLSNIIPKYKIGQFVYSVTDPDQYRMIVTAYVITATAIQYECSFRGECSVYHSIEISEDKELML
jgi:hypothetical protein|tara:strand:+ start:667 stop:936 length:270 start_codon:yes stop_codon:yes gene_type:complete